VHGSPEAPLRRPWGERITPLMVARTFTQNLVDFSNTVPFHLSKGVGSGDFQLSPSIVSHMALGRCRHFYQVITFSHSHFQKNQAMCKSRRGETFRMRAHLSRYSKSIRLISQGVKGEMKDDQGPPEEPRCLFISVRGNGSTSRRAPSRFGSVAVS